MARFAIGSEAGGRGAGGMTDPIGGAITANADVATALTDFDTAGADAVTALGIITYSAATHQFSGSFVSGPSPTAANLNALVTALNTALTALIAVQTALANQPAVAPDVVVSYDAAKFGNSDTFQRTVKAILSRATGLKSIAS